MGNHYGPYPVENVSWEEVNQFIEKLNKISNKKFRLPTEAEWEFVAKEMFKKEVGVTTHENELKKKRKTFFDRTTWYYTNSRSGTQPVGQKDPSLEVYDLLGNVSEWCFDFYQPNFQNQQPNDPRGPATGEKKVIKGGSYKDKEEDLRIEMRNADLPSAKSKTVGFRLVSEAN
jgi:formylglycine-generating enzyme required for sulfatase activity